MRFYFHIFASGEFIEDHEGTECRDLESAKVEAKASARDLASQAMQSGVSPDTQCVEIQDQFGRILFALNVGEIVDEPNHPKFHPTCGVPSGKSLH